MKRLLRGVHTPDLLLHADPHASVAAGSGLSLDQVLRQRNAAWSENPLVPSWVEPSNVGLDQFYTRPEIARECHASLLGVMRRDRADPEKFRFVEPSAGGGAFFDLLPSGRRTGIELVPGRKEFIQADFLGWCPPEPLKGSVVVGNPPFGSRAWLALAFMNHAATFAGYIGMILPMAFQSDGKGSPKHRVVGAELVEMSCLPKGAFVTPDGRPASVNALWQVWRKGENVRSADATCKQWVDLFTVDNRKERLCGQERISEADWFLQRTFFRDIPQLVRDFGQVKYGCGYGIVARKQKRAIKRCLEAIDWRKYSNLAAHNCRHISMYHIRRALTDHGFVDA